MNLRPKPDGASPASYGCKNIDKKKRKNTIKEDGACDVSQRAQVRIKHNDADDEANGALNKAG